MPDSPAHVRTTQLREKMEECGVSVYLIPHADEYQGEYVPDSAMRLAWLTGFTGSAGLAIAAKDRAAVFVDGRYVLQVRKEVDGDVFEYRHLTDEPPQKWLAGILGKGDKVGFDPWLHTPVEIEKFADICTGLGAELTPLYGNLIDALWIDRPAAPKAPIRPYEIRYAGESSIAKRQQIAGQLVRLGQAAQILTASDSIAWLLNVRGGDVAFTPVPLCFALLHADASVDLFVDPDKTDAKLIEHLGPDIRLHNEEKFGEALDQLCQKAVRVDPQSAPIWIALRLHAAKATPVYGDDLCILPKACKNSVEQDGVRAAHLRDAVPLCRLLAWLASNTPKEDVTEIDVVKKLEQFRQKADLYQEPSFATISAFGPNGAITHYRVSAQSCLALKSGGLYLIDSGGQYLDGTTDVTRTIAIGPATAEQKRAFTLVLKGHIALASARFPIGTVGSQLDALARRPLWDAGLDFDHGTGHGVGAYLSVHEGPQRISKIANSIALIPGMIISNEPGYYKDGAFGIRIENLLLVKKSPDVFERSMLEFETLTLAPIDRALIEIDMLEQKERAWIDAYHRSVQNSVAAQLNDAERAWLEEATRAL